MAKRMKVLVSAYACEPDKGSEPGVGWNWVKQIARFHEVWAITRENNREAIEQAVTREPIPNVHWVYFDLPHWARFWKKGQRGVHLYYYLWQIGTYFVGKGLHRKEGFDLVHHVTFVNYWMPSFFSLLPIPFIWGPVGGGDSTPRHFCKKLSLRGQVYERLRHIACRLGEHDPFVRLTVKRAQLALAATRKTEERLHWLGCQHVKVLSQIAMTSDEFTSLRSIPFRNANPFRLVNIGRLLHWKGFHFGLRAFARFQRDFPNSEYWLIGDGPEHRNLRHLAQGLGVADKVRFLGDLPRQQVLEKLAECDVLVHPSLHDSGGWVCLEAMAAGRPVICLDLGGPALQVTEETGFKVPAITPEQVVNDLAQAMSRLAREPNLRKGMGEAARRRGLEHFDWDKKGEWIDDAYQGICKPVVRENAAAAQHLKVLVSAYACEPDKGSEPGVGWNWVKQIARFHEVWVITRANNRAAIEQALTKEPMPNVHWIYFDLPHWAKFWKKGQRGVHLYYYLWQIGTHFVGKRLHREVGFNLAHHVTFVNYWIPSFLSLLPVPFIWGPVGGGDSTPKAFYKTLAVRGKSYECLRNIACWFGEHDPFVRFTTRRARISLAATPRTGERLNHLGCQNVKVISAVAMTGEEIASLESLRPRNNNPFRLVSIGRLLHLKGFHFGLRAFARFQQDLPNSEYWLIGEGPERRNLELLAQELGVADKVHFLGNLPRQQVLGKLEECDVLVHPSLHDSGSWVCLEAMAAGRPVICLDIGGPALQVTGEAGFKILAHTPDQVIHDLADAMGRLARNGELRAQMGKAARERIAQEYEWSRKGEELNVLYTEVQQEG